MKKILNKKIPHNWRDFIFLTTIDFVLVELAGLIKHIDNHHYNHNKQPIVGYNGGLLFFNSLLFNRKS